MRRSNLIAALAAGVFALASHQALAGADLAKGEKLFKRCKTCHSLEEGKKKVGPSLFGLFGRTAGSVEGYKYSKAMKESGIVWDEETLDAFLTKPKDLVPKTKMSFAGFKNEQDRIDIIAYLKEATQ